jgi:hypothetical protein
MRLTLTKISVLIISSSLFGIPSTVNADWESWLDKAQKTVVGEAPTANASALSSVEIVDGLKQALMQGSRTAIEQLGVENGYLSNPEVRIPLPEKLQTMEKGLRAIGQGALADNFITSMNRAAEQAVPQATDLFVDTISNMSLEDAQVVLRGTEITATEYLRNNSGARLHQLMLPIIKETTDKVGVTSNYKTMISNASFFGNGVGIDAMDLDNYITEQATNGLFYLIAAEEKRIRENPVARTTDLLKKVFASAL